MSLTLRTDLGYTEAIIADEGSSLQEFYRTADLFNRDLQIRFIHKEDEFDSLNWEFKFKGHYLTLQYSIYNGISVFPSKTTEAVLKDNQAVVTLVNRLEAKLATKSVA